MSDKVIWNIQISNKIVRNKNINCEEFTLYFLLKKFSKDNIINIYHDELLQYLKWSVKTFKKYILILYQHKLIKEEYTTLPKHKKLKITLTKIDMTQHFTQLPYLLMYDIKNIGTIGLRLLYYYKSFINDINNLDEYACPSVARTYSETGISDKSIKKYRKILEEKKYIRVKENKIMGLYRNNSTHKYFTKFNYYYYINIDAIEKIKVLDF